jgi:hypothetical protein
MIYRRRRSSGSAPTGYYRFENIRTRAGMHGYGDGEFVRLRDEYGNLWNGRADVQDENVIRYSFRDATGKSITGVSDSYGIVLRDEKGNTWRGFVE